MSAKRRIIPIFVTHAGCPNHCVFCNQKRISGSLFPVSHEDVTKILSTLDRDTVYEAAFYGGSFTAVDPEYQESLLSAVLPFIHSGKIESVRISTRPDAIDPDTLKRLKKYGVSTIELGTQSMCDEVLARSGRGHSALDTIKAAELIKRNGFQMILQMMTGLPGSNDQTDLETAEKLILLKPDGVRIYPTVIIADTALENMWREGAYKEHTVEDAVQICSRIVPLFQKAKIPVIRLGLNPSSDLSAGAAIAGAYHPALGEMVYSRILYNTVLHELEDLQPGEDVVLETGEKTLSVLVGQHRENIIKLEKQFRDNRFIIKLSRDNPTMIRVIRCQNNRK